MTGDHPFDNEFSVTLEQKTRFETAGVVKLKRFFNASVVDALRERVDIELGGKTPTQLQGRFEIHTRAEYDFESNKNEVYELLARPYLQRALTDLTGCDLFLTFENCFELEKNVSQGLSWHVGIQSFGYQVAEEFGCTLWTPLHPVDTQGQRGGMAYVPESVISGDFIFQYIESAIVSALEAKESAGKKTSAGEYLGMRTGILNSPPMVDILEYQQVEDDFELGDVLLFNKNVIHKSVRLGEGMLPRRAAHVMRFVDAGSHYDLQRALNLEFPARKYAKGLIPYKPFTRQHIEIAEAGAEDGAVLAECAYFKDRERRIVRREPSPQPG